MRVYLAVLLALWLQNTQALNATVIDDSGPNPMVVGKAFGFMLFGNDGLMKPGIENPAVDGCIVSYEIDGGFDHTQFKELYSTTSISELAISRVCADYVNDVVLFEIYGDTGLREIRYDHTFDTEEECAWALHFLASLLGLKVKSKSSFLTT